LHASQLSFEPPTEICTPKKSWPDLRQKFKVHSVLVWSSDRSLRSAEVWNGPHFSRATLFRSGKSCLTPVHQRKRRSERPGRGPAPKPSTHNCAPHPCPSPVRRERVAERWMRLHFEIFHPPGAVRNENLLDGTTDTTPPSPITSAKTARSIAVPQAMESGGGLIREATIGERKRSFAFQYSSAPSGANSCLMRLYSAR
jgi:hypothetical protein